MSNDSDASTIGAIYDEFGDYYNKSRKEDHGRFSNEFIDVPTLLSVLDTDLKDQRVLDAGCGSGIIAQLLAGKGAKVNAVDASKRMIEIAQTETPAGLDITYATGNVAQLSFPDATFDLIVCNYVLENVGDIETVFHEFRRVLKDSGKCIFSVSHPLRACAEKMERDGEEVWVLRDYFNRSMRQSDFGGGMVVPKYRRPLEDYAQTVSSAGFFIDRLIEPQPVPDGKAMHPEAYEKAMRLPQLLSFEIVCKP
ncbi:MAG TPA: class I SAM-dependent methyltransferase [Mycobacteriales bacterium]|nr:class I SAM-dependent methyltransferase [Mycobacteriales bacterium]